MMPLYMMTSSIPTACVFTAKNLTRITTKMKTYNRKSKPFTRNSTSTVALSSLLLLQMLLLLFISSMLTTPTDAVAVDDAKDQIQQRLKNRFSPADLLKEYSETPLSLPANATTLESIESSIFSWTGAKILPKKLQRHETQQQQPKRKKAKKQENFFIANNIEFSKHMTEETPTISASDALSSSSNSNNNKHQRNKHKQSQYQQQQRKRNNQHQHRQQQKLHRNALRLLSSQTDTTTTTVGGLFPPLFNVAPRAIISVNATCGQSGREEYCKLIDAYPHKKSATQCGVCNSHSSDISKQRPIEAVISTNPNFEENWWQSPTLQYGRQYEYVTITLDLKQVYQVFFVMLKTANSPRPASWILERSLDGVNYAAWQYFGLSDVDCRRRYGLAGQNGKYIFQNDTEVICTTQFSKALPLEHGELHVSLLKNRPGANEQSAELLDFITARFIRIRLQGMHSTANLDNSVDWLLDAQSLEKRSYYSLKQIRISARLDCHGHADRTVELANKKFSNESDNESSTIPMESMLQCFCQHNTCGINCNECCPLFRDQPFQNGTVQAANECEVCQCNGHAQSCVYDEFLERGVCENCCNHTAGNECEFCLGGFYRAVESPISDPCLPCNCSESGSDGSCQPVGGDCHCREGFQGPRCEECAVGFYGDDCRKCECDSSGSIDKSECTGLCQCKSNVEGDTCAVCQPGFYDLSEANAEGCTSCWCSGVGLTCSSAQLQTLSFENLNDWKITDITRSFTALPILDTASNRVAFSMDDMDSKIEAIYWQAPQGYVGNRLTSYGSRLSVQVSWTTIRGDTSGTPTTGPHIILWGYNGLKIAFGDSQFPPGSSSAVINVTLDEQDWYHVPNEVRDIKTRLRRNDYHGSAVTRTQFLSVLASLDTLLIRGAYHTDQVETSLEHAIIFSGGSELGGKPTTRVEQCVCPTGYTGLSCEGCDFGFIRIFENMTDHQLVGKCIPCPCNGHSNSCDLQNGGCGNCMHNTFGERCERCKMGYYGNPLQGTPNDCKRCACPLLVESNNFSPSCQLKSYNVVDVSPVFGVIESAEYICTQCPLGYTGDHCEMCDDGFFGNPTVEGSTCERCDCAGGPCDVFTGECIECRGNTEGYHCERCKRGYWGDPAVGCEACDCYEDGASSGDCDSTNGQCLCKPRFAGQKCDQCDVGYANVDLKCLPCNCDAYGSVNLDYCEPDSGQYDCKPGVVGLKCNECADEHFGLKEESNGCQGKFWFHF